METAELELEMQVETAETVGEIGEHFGNVQNIGAFVKMTAVAVVLNDVDKGDDVDKMTSNS